MLKTKMLLFSFIIFMIGCQKNQTTKNNENTNIINIKPGGVPVIAKTKAEFKKSSYFKEDRVKDDKYDVMQNGNEVSYNELLLYYDYNISKRHELLPYTLFMIEKHKKYNYCTNAFENLYEFYTDQDIHYCDGTDASYIQYFKKINTLEPRVRNYCLSFIELGSKNEDTLSLKFLEIFYRYGFGFNKDIQKADSLKLAYQKKSEIDFNKYRKK
ncbi:conserved hypothetical protein [Flavobacterium sp. 9R]|uniref:hypothetical protein n=1 Tax=Flavobacterium sp. 9R TaxID=2653143 RepID=UPI0012F3BAC8|nr:hypothetical protein [Flavobacterium sp. 9R]VXB32835.1 conserved hypothetical protein [Flavobacterium sp. 9R]